MARVFTPMRAVFQEPETIVPEEVPRPEPAAGLTGQPYLDALLQEIRGADPASLSLSTAEVIATMRATLWTQRVADDGGHGVGVPWAS